MESLPENIKQNGIWIDDEQRIEKDDASIYIPPSQQALIEYVLITRKQITGRCKELAQKIFKDYKGQTLLIVVITTGAFQFFNVLNEALIDYRDEVKPQTTNEDVTIEYKFKKISSYVNTSSVGIDKMKMDHNKPEEYKSKNILIIEDIYDTGDSMTKLLEVIQSFDPKSVKSAILLYKRNPDNKYKYIPDYIGFWCPNLFVLGFGMDYNEYLRDLRHICISSN